MGIVCDVTYVVVYFYFYGFVLDCCVCSEEVVFSVNINDSLELDLPNCVALAHLFSGILIVVAVLID